MARQKLWIFRRWTLVLTLPRCRTSRRRSARVSMMTRGSRERSAWSFAAVSQRSRVGPDFERMISSRASFQVRVATPESLPAK